MTGITVPKKYSKICDNCHGNGYVTVVDKHTHRTNVHQCWICESQGEIKNYDTKEVDTFIYNYTLNKRLH